MKPKYLILNVLCLLFLSVTSFATNPEISKYLKNLSSAMNTEPIDDVAPEIVVQGNTVHVVWIENKYGTQNPMYYCRSVNLGQTWETPVLIGKLVDKQYAVQPAVRKLAVDGNNVHIAYCDYNYSDNGTGRIFYTKSTNNGASFDQLKEVATSGGGYRSIYASSIKAANGKVAIAYVGEGSKTGVWLLYSSNVGTSFTDTKVFEEGNDLVDFYFDGTQMIILHNYGYYYYGLNVGRVYVTVSNNGTTAKTNKISITYNPTPTTTGEKGLARHDQHYSQKIAKSGNNIHVVFEGTNEALVWTNLYARSTDNGQTFEKAIDINNGTITNLQGGQETIETKNGNIYIAYLSTGSVIYFLKSNNNGNSFTAPQRIGTSGISWVEGSWWIGLVADPNDESGKSVYVTGNGLFSAKSTDGGNTFSNFSFVAPGLKSIIANIKSDMEIDSKGGLHWITEARWRNGSDLDIMYKNVPIQPEPGMVNKALLVEDFKSSYEAGMVVVPSSKSLDLDSAMTAEAWVKFLPGTNYSVNVLAKVNGYDGYDYVPTGYNMGFRYGDGKVCVNSGIKTDKGEFVNWGDCSIMDTLWHHVAFTYDAKAGPNNFKTYVDGLLKVKQTVTGGIIKGEGMLILGSRQAISSWYSDQRYYLDEIRLWNRALTQEELLANQAETFSGKENNLKLYLNFDDTFKDISGNGNDAIPIYNGQLNISNFNPPLAGFDMYQTANQISFNNKTVNGKSYVWNFGDGKTSELGNPKYTYPTPGEYDIFLTAKNLNSVTSAKKNATIEGLDRVEPTKAGNLGYASVTVFGGGLKPENTKLILRKEGETDIVGSEVFSPGTGGLAAFFDLYQKKIGDWDVVVSKNGVEMKLPKAFKIIAGIEAKPWVNFSGRGAILLNRWQSYTINYGNNGNVDAYAVPLWIAITNQKGMDVEFIDFELVVPDAVEQGEAAEIRKLDTFFETDMVLGKPMNARVYPIVIPVIPANSSNSVHIRLKAPESFEVKVWMNQPWVDYVPEVPGVKSGELSKSQLKLKAAECVTGVLAEGIVDIGTSAIPGVGCAWSIGKQVYQTSQTPPWDKKFSFWSTMWNSAITFVDCGINLSGVGGIVKGVGVFMANMGNYAKSIKECTDILKETSLQSQSIRTVSSFDPNEMIGPAGFGTENYIQKNNLLPYSILFENKSTASAPAHIVTIKDTLNLSKFDLTEFGFGAFGWGDTIFTLSGNKLKKFSKDIDMRPDMNLITRVSGKLDSLNGIVTWEFLSLNPTTMNLEEDPFIGFLPPNKKSPEGEGFVSFSVGLKKELGTNAEIRNKASIIFDENKPILTNEYVNTLDIDKPESRVYQLDATIDSRFPVSWTGSDKGSGIGAYTIYVLKNDTLLYPWKTNTSQITADFEGEVGSSYKFYSLATDNVSLTEITPGTYDAQTTITVDVKQFDAEKQNLRVWPNPVKDNFTVEFKNAPCGMYVLELVGSNGSAIHSQLYSDIDLNQSVNISVKNCLPGQYVLRIIFGNKTETMKIMIQ